MKLISVLLSSVLALVVVEASAQERVPSPATVTVIGQASEDARPDIAWISLTVRDQKSTAAEASNDNARRADAVIAALTAAGVDAKDIATVGLTLNPVWSGGSSPRSVTAFEATNRLSVRVQPVDKAGPILAQAVLAGAEYQGVGFDVSDREARQDALRGKAVENAARRAALYAGGALMKLGALQSIHAEAAQPVFRAFAAAASSLAAASAPPPPIEPGPITLSESVTATWTIVSP